MSFKTHIHSGYTAELVEGDFELPIGPAADYMDHYVEVIGNTAVLGYLAHDDDASNPMEQYDCRGKLYTYNEGVITDDASEVLSALGLSGLGSRFYSREKDLDHCGVDEKALELLRPMCVLPGGEHFDDFVAFCREEYEAVEDVSDSTLAVRMFDNDLDFSSYGTVIPSWLETAYENMREEAWDILWENGMIGEYLAVPVTYHMSVHGPGTTQIYTSDIDDCNAVWVPDVDLLDDILSVVPGFKVVFDGEKTVRTLTIGEETFTWTKTFPEKLRALLVSYHTQFMKRAEEMANGILDEYESWCNGETYGVVIATYTRTDDDSEWELSDKEDCWCLIGGDHAEEYLKEMFDNEVERVEKKNADKD